MLLLTSSAGFVQASQIHSESFSLLESASVSRSVFANEGDRIVGNFTVSNIPIWTDAITGNSETVQYAFKLSKIEGSEQCPTDIVLYEVDQAEHASFDVICEYTGNYRFRFNVGIGAPDVGIGRMEATINYDVVQNSSYVRPVEKTPTSDGQSNIEHPTTIIGPVPHQTEPFSPLSVLSVFVVLTLLVVGVLVYNKFKAKNNLVKKP